MKKVLVTGATGFIGKYVITELKTRKVEIIATSKQASKARDCIWLNNVTYSPLDFGQLKEEINYQQFFNNPDLVIHLAWEGLPNYQSEHHISQNLPNHFKFISNLIRHHQKDITVAGTCFEYGLQEGALTEDMETRPTNSYAIAKDTLRKRLEVLQNEYGYFFKWVRLFYMYGEGQSQGSLFTQLNIALQQGDKEFNMSGGQQIRDFLPVEKMAQYIVDIALQNKVTGIINCCSGVGIKLVTFIQDYLKWANKTIKLNLGFYSYSAFEPMNFWGTTNKLNKIVHG